MVMAEGSDFYLPVIFQGAGIEVHIEIPQLIKAGFQSVYRRRVGYVCFKGFPGGRYLAWRSKTAWIAPAIGCARGQGQNRIGSLFEERSTLAAAISIAAVRAVGIFQAPTRFD